VGRGTGSREATMERIDEEVAVASKRREHSKIRSPTRCRKRLVQSICQVRAKIGVSLSEYIQSIELRDFIPKLRVSPPRRVPYLAFCFTPLLLLVARKKYPSFWGTVY
jgi:hypothetical protein